MTDDDAKDMHRLAVGASSGGVVQPTDAQIERVAEELKWQLSSTEARQNLDLSLVWKLIHAALAVPQAPLQAEPVPVVASEPTVWVSPKQLAAFTSDPAGDHGHYLPMRRKPAGKFTQPLFATPQAEPAVAEQARPPLEPDGRMWSIGRAEFIHWAQQYEDARSADKASIIADVAGSDIWRAMYRAALASQSTPPPCQHRRQRWNLQGGGHCSDCGAPVGTSVLLNTAPPVRSNPCKDCGGTGMDGDVGDQGQVITIDCSACHGTGEMSDAAPPLVRLRFFRDLTDEQRLLVFKVFGVLPEGAEGEAGTHYVQGLLLKRMCSILSAGRASVAEGEQS